MDLNDLLSKRNAPNEADRIDAALKNAECVSRIKVCSWIAAAIAIVPLPLADSFFIIITQLFMVNSLCKRFNRPMGFSLVLIIISAMIGPTIFTALMELLPVAGSVIGAVVGGVFTFFVGTITHSLLKKGKQFTFKNFIDYFRG
jgi:uncharacterized protein (DUF697 family)